MAPCAQRMAAARGLWLSIPILGVLELAGDWYFSRRAPDAADWEKVPGLVEQLRRPGDLVVVAPQWAEPLARHTLGDAVMPLRDVARSDTTGYRVLLELAMHGAESEEVQGFRELSQLEDGPFRLRRLENPHYRPVLYRFDDQVRPGSLEVSEGSAPDSASCPFTDRAPSSSGGLGGHATYPRERFVCSGGEPFFVGVTVIDDQRYRPRRCIFAHPPAGGGPLRLVFGDVPAGSAIVGYAGLPYLIFRDGIGTPVTLAAFVDGERVGESVHRDEDGFVRFEFPIPEALRRLGEVRFEISSAEPNAREYCFTAELR